MITCNGKKIITFAAIKNAYGTPISLFKNEIYAHSQQAIHMQSSGYRYIQYTIYIWIATHQSKGIVYRHTNTIVL